MASKIDFNLLLAKADKNTNNACKILEEKKLQNQKIQQKHNQKNEQQSKQAAIDFLNRKREEIRQRTEREAKELLEKKQKKNESQQQILSSSTASLSSNNSNSNKNSLIKKTNSNIPVKHKEVKTSTASLKPISNGNKNEKLNSKNQANNNNNSKLMNSKPKASEPSKPKLSYSQILKLAENNQQDKLKTNSTDTFNSEIVKKSNKLPGDMSTSIKAVNLNNKQDNINNVTKTISNKTQLSDNRPNILKQMSNQANVLTSKQTAQSSIDNKSKKEFLDSKNKNLNNRQPISNINNPANESKSISSWDRIISDMKKKKTIKKHEQSNIETKIYDEYEDEDEYDSEMDDFIDDDDVDNNSSEKKNDYSKCIREIFKYNPNRYKADDEDDIDNMETDFHTLQKEEKRSLKLGIMEDIEELKKEEDRQKKERQKKRQSDGEINNKNKKLKSKT